MGRRGWLCPRARGKCESRGGDSRGGAPGFQLSYHVVGQSQELNSHCLISFSDNLVREVAGGLGLRETE